MTTKMQIVIALRKTIPDIATGEALAEIVKAKMADHPEVTVSPSISVQFIENE